MDFTEIATLGSLTTALNNHTRALEDFRGNNSALTPKRLASLESNLDKIANRLQTTNVILLTTAFNAHPGEPGDRLLETLRTFCSEFDAEIVAVIDGLRIK